MFYYALLLAACLAGPAAAVQEAAVAPAAAAQLRTVGQWDHPYTITEHQDIPNPIMMRGQYTVERVGTKSSLMGDFNGDGVKDMVTRGSRGRTYVLFGQNNFEEQTFEYTKVPRGNWDTVNQACKDWGGELASIHNEREMAKVKEVCGEWACYIGLTRENSLTGYTGTDGPVDGIGPWYWTDGTPTRFIRWDRRQPQHGTHSRYPAGETKVVFTGSNGDKWHDWGYGAYSFSGVCKKVATTSPIPTELDPQYLNGFNGFIIRGSNPSAIAHGDINNDGIDDLILGDQWRRVPVPAGNNCNCLHQAGVTFVILGTRSGFPREIHVNWLFGWNGFRVDGFAAWGRFGHSASSGGDINGDGIQDMIVGTFDIDSTAVGMEEVFALYGKAFSQNPVYDLDTWAWSWSSTKQGTATGSIFQNTFPLSEIFMSQAIAAPPSGDQYIRGFVLRGVPPSAWHWLGRDRTGYSLSSSGDINNDGVADIVIGSYGATPGDLQKVMAGAVYVIFGKNSSSTFPIETPMDTLAWPSGFKIIGDRRWDLTGLRVDTSGDINGDGIKDIAIGAPGADHRYLDANNRYRWTWNVGMVYVIFGKPALGQSGDIDLGNLVLPTGFGIRGVERGVRLGEQFAIGDVNSDGFDDIAIGMPRASFDFKFSMKGGAHLFYGRSSYTSPFADSQIAASELHGNEGMTISGFELFDMAGQSVSIGDFSGDGKPELLIGVPSHWLIARVWEKTGTAYILEVSSTAAVQRTTTPEPVVTNTTLMEFCQCPQDANATTYALCVTLEATETGATAFEAFWGFVSTSLNNLLTTGNSSVYEDSPTAPSNIRYQTYEGTDNVLNIHITVLVDGFAEASAALARYEGHGDFEITVRDKTDLDLNVVGSPGVQNCAALPSAPPLQIDASGFAIRGIEFDWRCMSTGCWVIDVIYTRGPENAVNTFYLPRADTGFIETADVDEIGVWLNAPAQTTVTYPDSVKDTYLPKNFPCGTTNYDPTVPAWDYTGCCIQKFLEDYRPVGEFADFLASNYAQSCTTSDLSAGPFSADVFTAPLTAAKGIFSDLYLSNFEDKPMIAPGIYAAQIKIDENELLRYAGMIDPSSSILRKKVETFVGMVNYIPTDYKFLDSSAAQIRLTLEKGDFFTVGSSGETQSTFIDYMYMRLHEVKEDENNWMQYVAVTFTLSADYDVNEVTGAVPLSSVRVGKGLVAEAADWQQACTSDANDAIYDDTTLQTDFTTLLQKDCAPSPRFCTNQAAISDSFIAFHIPVGRNYFSTVEDYDAGNKIFVEFVVSVVNKNTNIQSSTVMTAEMPVMPGGTSLWCEAFTATAELKEIATTDLLVGSAGTIGEMARLNSIENIDSASIGEGVELASYSAASLESGLLTLIAKGDPTVFERDGFKAYSMEMEHLLTVHVMETGGITSSTVQSLIESGGAFEVKTDEIAQTGYLEPTPALLEVCTFTPKTPTLSDPIPSPCILRRDVEFNKCPVVVGAPCQSIEINYQDTAEAERFMQTLLGTNDYAKNLGKNFSTLLSSEYSLNGRYNRAWWINPGHIWNPILADGKFQLSQHVMVAALVRLKGSYTPGAAASTRRSIIVGGNGANGLRQTSSPGDFKRGSIGGNIRFTQGDAGDSTRTIELMAEVLSVPKETITTFKHVVKLTSTQACSSADALKEAMQEQLLGLWKESDEDVTKVFVTSATVTLNGLSCGARRRNGMKLMRNGQKLRAEASQLTDATAEVEAAVVVKEGTTELSICVVANHETIDNLVKIYADASIKVDSTSALGGDCTAGGDDSSSSDGFSLFGLATGVTIGILAGGGALLCCCCVCCTVVLWKAFGSGNQDKKVHPMRKVSDAMVMLYRQGSGTNLRGNQARPIKDAYTIRVPSPENVTRDDGSNLVAEELPAGGKATYNSKPAWGGR